MTTATETQILQRLESLEQMLMRLLVPVAQQAGRQQARLTNDERKAANKAEREKSKLARARITSTKSGGLPK